MELGPEIWVLFHCYKMILLSVSPYLCSFPILIDSSFTSAILFIESNMRKDLARAI